MSQEKTSLQKKKEDLACEKERIPEWEALGARIADIRSKMSRYGELEEQKEKKQRNEQAIAETEEKRSRFETSIHSLQEALEKGREEQRAIGNPQAEGQQAENELHRSRDRLKRLKAALEKQGEWNTLKAKLEKAQSEYERAAEKEDRLHNHYYRKNSCLLYTSRRKRKCLKSKEPITPQSATARSWKKRRQGRSALYATRKRSRTAKSASCPMFMPVSAAPSALPLSLIHI